LKKDVHDGLVCILIAVPKESFEEYEYDLSRIGRGEG
jgi:hypothetical protein